MKTYTDKQLKLALAKELFALIGNHLHGDCSHDELATTLRWREGTKLGERITPREWLWIVAECEKKLDGFSGDQYLCAIHEEVNNNVRRCWKVSEANCWDIATATWQQRATAYFKTVGKEIE